MGHGIDATRDFQIGLENAWHKKTVIVPAISRELFPEVARLPLFYTLPNGQVRAWAGTSVPVSLDDGFPVGVSSGDTYGDFTPRDAWDHVEKTLAGTRHTVSSIGMIFNRSRWFLSVDLDELRDVARKGESYNLVWSGGLAKNQSPMCSLSHVRAVCANTVAVSRSQGQTLFTARLTGRFAEKLNLADDEIGRAVGMARIFSDTLAGLAMVPATIDDARDIYAGELAENNADLKSTKTSNTLDALVSLFQRGAGNDGNDREDVLNGFTEYFGRGTGDSKKDSFARWTSSEFGVSASRKSAFVEGITSPDGWDRLIDSGRRALTDARRNAVTVA
jgi:hypothetical protein